MKRDLFCLPDMQEDQNLQAALTPAKPGKAAAAKPLLIYIHGSAELYGSDKVMLNLACACLADGDFAPVVLLHEDGPLRRALIDAGVEVHVGSVAKISRAMFGLAAPLRLAQAARSACADLDAVAAGRAVGLVYSNTLAVLGGAVWARRRKLPHLWHVHEIIRKPWAVQRGLAWLANRLSDAVICNSQQTAAWLLSQEPGLKSRCHVVFNGMPDFPAPRPEQARIFRSRMGAAADDVLVTVAGRLNHWKGQDLLIEALHQLRLQGKGERLRLAIVGDVYAGQHVIRERLLQQVEQSGLQERVQFLPFVTDIQSVWMATDIAAVPSLEPEPFGMVAIEAMACGLPVVAAAHGGLLDIVTPEETGLLFQPCNAQALALALDRLAGDAVLRRRMGLAGAARQQANFSMAGQIAATRTLCLTTSAG